MKTDNIACNTRQGDDRQCRAESPGRGYFKGVQTRAQHGSNGDKSFCRSTSRPMRSPFGKEIQHARQMVLAWSKSQSTHTSSHASRFELPSTRTRSTRWGCITRPRPHGTNPLLLCHEDAHGITVVASRHRSIKATVICVLKSHSQGKNSLDTRGQNTAIRPGLTPAKMLVLTL